MGHSRERGATGRDAHYTLRPTNLAATGEDLEPILVVELAVLHSFYQMLAQRGNGVLVLVVQHLLLQPVHDKVPALPRPDDVAALVKVASPQLVVVLAHGWALHLTVGAPHMIESRRQSIRGRTRAPTAGSRLALVMYK